MQSELESLQAELTRSQLDLQREKKLFPAAASARANLDAAIAQVGNLQGKTRAAQARLKLLNEGFRPEEVAEAVAEVARFQANLDLLEAGTRWEEIAEAEAHVAELKAKLKEIEVNLQSSGGRLRKLAWSRSSRSARRTWLPQPATGPRAACPGPLGQSFACPKWRWARSG